MALHHGGAGHPSPAVRQGFAWVRDTFGERSDRLRAVEVWEHGVRLAARYRVEHDITDPGEAIGPRPEQREGQRDWERARKAMARDQRQLGRDVEVELGAAQVTGTFSVPLRRFSACRRIVGASR